jgi:hypothetical protein
MLTTNINNRKIENWALNLQMYDPTIQYISGKSNTFADMFLRATQLEEAKSGEESPDIDEKYYKINMINTNGPPNEPTTSDKNTN